MLDWISVTRGLGGFRRAKTVSLPLYVIYFASNLPGIDSKLGRWRD